MRVTRVPLLISAVATLGFTACRSQAAYENDHWTPYSIGPSLSRNILGYSAENDGDYKVFQWKRKKSIELTLRRHFFNNNPDNPFEPYDPSVNAPRPNHSLFPNFVQYIHVEGILLGAATTAFSPILYPIPVDSIIGTFEEGGGDEFVAGIQETARPMGQATASFLHDALGFPETEGDAWRHAPERH